MQLDPQPFKMLVARLRFVCAAIDGAIGIEEVERVQAEDSQFSWYDFNKEPAPSFKSMTLLFWDELPPDMGELSGPPGRASLHDVVGHNIIVAPCRDNRYSEVVGWIPIINVVTLAPNLCEFGDEHLVQIDDFAGCAWYLGIAIMSRRVASPNDEIDFIFEVVIEPLECCIDKSEWRITIRRLGAEDTCRPGITMACRLCRC